MCDLHNKKCIKNYKIISFGTELKEASGIQLAEMDDETRGFVFMGSHNRSSMDGQMDNPYLTLHSAKYALESEDCEMSILNLDNVRC